MWGRSRKEEKAHQNIFTAQSRYNIKLNWERKPRENRGVFGIRENVFVENIFLENK